MLNAAFPAARIDRAAGPVTARGPLSLATLDLLRLAPECAASQLGAFDDALSTAIESCTDVINDGDLQLTLFLLYGMCYGSIPGTDDRWEWDSTLIQARLDIESVFEKALRTRIHVPQLPAPTAKDVSAALFALTAPSAGPSLSRYVARHASRDQLEELLIQKSIYTLREADPHSWAIPRLSGRPKAALVEIQSDEYGAGRPERMHSTIFAGTMTALGLDTTYGAYIDAVPAISLASHNMMSMFGLNRRLRGAIVGHLAAFEMTSSIPNRKYGDGFRRLGFDKTVTLYFDEHVAADALHEQIAGKDLAGSLAEDEPLLLADIMFGAAACLAVDDLVGAHILSSWNAGRSSLRTARG